MGTSLGRKWVIITMCLWLEGLGTISWLHDCKLYAVLNIWFFDTSNEMTERKTSWSEFLTARSKKKVVRSLKSLCLSVASYLPNG